MGRPKATMVSGARQILGSPSTGYQSRSPATKTLGSWWKRVSSPSLIRTIHLNWRVFSAMGSPLSSGYSTAERGGFVMIVLMVVKASDGLDRRTVTSVCHRIQK